MAASMRILLVADDAVLGVAMLCSLQEAGHRMELAVTLAQARHFWLVQRFNAVLLDLNLPDGNGLTALREARAPTTARQRRCRRPAITPTNASPASMLAPTTIWASLSGIDASLNADAIEAFISRLRKKLAGSGAGIRTLRGLGYVLEVRE